MYNKQAQLGLGTLGAILWSIQIFPQLYHTYRRKTTVGFSAWMVASWCVGGLFLGSYNIVSGVNVALIVQPQCFTVLLLCCFGQYLHYDYDPKRFTTFTCAALVSAVSALIGGLEVGFVYAIRAGRRHGVDWPATLFGVLSLVFIAGGLLPQYYEIYRFKRVLGMSFIFLFVDLMGGVFSLLSLVFSQSFEGLAAGSYIAVIALEAGIFLLAAILNPIAARNEEMRSTEDLQTSTAGETQASEASTLAERDHGDLPSSCTKVEAMAGRR
ncbi:uncharacterized protein L969DRAFT_95692 [Mixia osmundae IAM 14324]|uniref:Uncharacterized protein n=1 Tax=Mixia osmundae (strain CBS 9802 / IAM 14324 / JCM 22182 / KY 12970) TaxID=764103 RepID=G7EAB8_MIXOS|nr:uncharacterized protein L969DRAFT_95692 [Mixia osmundae IAM 14324]KEI37837.1 hypothetical protein L969DRAFT_95692 [Mixia osmundae IAM 14324]GAA99778.1 hypothetical protein E5Q_06481 [Mixia osmundae IAM 14324]